jgi:hypothetical protein
LTSLLQGSLLVLIVLGFVPAAGHRLLGDLGIPVSFAGGFILMPWFGITANVMSIFGFIIVVGIIVDDAIVTAENVYIKLRSGMDPLDAATEGTKEVALPVTFGALTTIVAFIPLMFFEGFYGSFTKQIPPVVAAVLLFSLIESKLVLPCHLKYVQGPPQAAQPVRTLPEAHRRRPGTLRHRFYEPTLRFATRHRYSTLAVFSPWPWRPSGISAAAHSASSTCRRSTATGSTPRSKCRATPRWKSPTCASACRRRRGTLRKEFVDPGTGKSLIGDVSPPAAAGPAAPVWIRARDSSPSP